MRITINNMSEQPQHSEPGTETTTPAPTERLFYVVIPPGATLDGPVNHAGIAEGYRSGKYKSDSIAIDVKTSERIVLSELLPPDLQQEAEQRNERNMRRSRWMLMTFVICFTIMTIHSVMGGKEEVKKDTTTEGVSAMLNSGEQKEIERGIEQLRRSANNGNPDSAYELGLYYLNGLYVEKNEQQAKLLLEKAARSGHEKADKLLLQLQPAE